MDFNNIPITLLEQVCSIWFPNEKLNEQKIKFLSAIVENISLGNEEILSKEKGLEILYLLQDYEIIDPKLTANDLIEIGKNSNELEEEIHISPELMQEVEEQLEQIINYMNIQKRKDIQKRTKFAKYSDLIKSSLN